VDREKLNTIVVNLYPGNKGYSLALHYDEHMVLNPQTNEWSPTDKDETSSDAAGLGTGTGSHRSRPKPLAQDESQSKTEAGHAKHDFGLVEVLRWPYENDLLLQCIDREMVHTPLTADGTATMPFTANDNDCWHSHGTNRTVHLHCKKKHKTKF